MVHRKLLLSFFTLCFQAGISAARRGGGGGIDVHLPLELPPIPAAIFALRIILLVFLFGPISNLVKTFRTTSVSWSSPFVTLSIAIMFMVLAQALAIAYLVEEFTWNNYYTYPYELAYAASFFVGFLDIPMSLAIIHFIKSRYNVLAADHGISDPPEVKLRMTGFGLLGGILIFDLATVGMSRTFSYRSPSWRSDLRTIIALEDTSLTLYIILTILLVYSTFRLYKKCRDGTPPPVDYISALLLKAVSPLLLVRMVWYIVRTAIRKEPVDPDVRVLVGVILLDYPFYIIIYLLSRTGLPVEPIQGNGESQNGKGLVRDS
ncbi:hypothetical protein AX16_005742 [Volvariella volvacea WC 439]|nr:hypothetical protein AX16_005742 [Volvariella volvacea WC 439]